jgi:hypothetical protein
MKSQFYMITRKKQGEPSKLGPHKKLHTPRTFLVEGGDGGTLGAAAV